MIQNILWRLKQGRHFLILHIFQMTKLLHNSRKLITTFGQLTCLGAFAFIWWNNAFL